VISVILALVGSLVWKFVDEANKDTASPLGVWVDNYGLADSRILLSDDSSAVEITLSTTPARQLLVCTKLAADATRIARDPGPPEIDLTRPWFDFVDSMEGYFSACVAASDRTPAHLRLMNSEAQVAESSALNWTISFPVKGVPVVPRAPTLTVSGG
jgi:hypothetical protein